MPVAQYCGRAVNFEALGCTLEYWHRKGGTGDILGVCTGSMLIPGTGLVTMFGRLTPVQIVTESVS